MKPPGWYIARSADRCERRPCFGDQNIIAGDLLFGWHGVGTYCPTCLEYDPEGAAAHCGVPVDVLLERQGPME